MEKLETVHALRFYLCQQYPATQGIRLTAWGLVENISLQTSGLSVSSAGRARDCATTTSYHALCPPSCMVFCPLLRALASAPARKRTIWTHDSQLGAKSLCVLSKQNCGDSLHARRRRCFYRLCFRQYHLAAIDCGVAGSRLRNYFACENLPQCR